MNIKDINYDNLYYDKDVKVLNEHLAKYPIDLSIELRGIFDNKPDCKIGHFGYNFYLRTSAGLHYKKYTSRKHLELAVANLLIKNGFKVLEWILREVR